MRRARDFVVVLAMPALLACTTEPAASSSAVPAASSSAVAAASSGAAAGETTQVQRAQWILPAPGSEWTKGEMMAALSLPFAADPQSFAIFLNGADVTPAFGSPYSFRRSWLGAFQQAAGGEGAESEEDEAQPEGFSSWRLLATLDAAAFKAGENALQARFRDGAGARQTAETRFRFRPAGRRVSLRVVRERDGKSDEQASARVILVPHSGAPQLDLSGWPRPPEDSRTGSRRRSWAFARGGEVTVYLPEGSYRALATGGPLDSLDEWQVPATGDAEHVFRIRREVDLPGTASVDFHVHGAASRDSLVPLQERVWSFLAAGIDLFVASDHGDITDYRPIIAALPAAAGRIASIPAVEAGFSGTLAAGRSLGHWNIWPLEPDPAAGTRRTGKRSRHGALTFTRRGAEEEASPVAALFDAYRKQATELAKKAAVAPLDGGPVIQLNHPRGMHFRPEDTDPVRARDWFNKAAFDPRTPLPDLPQAAGDAPPAAGDAAPPAAVGDTSLPNAALVAPSETGTTPMDFDVLEIWNRSSRQLYLEVRRDWFSLLNQGYVKTATANSDTHNLATQLAGYPFNVVFLADDRPAGVATGVADLAAAVRAGRVVGSDGPVPLLTVSSGKEMAHPGDLLAVGEAPVTVVVEVRAASWVPVGTIRIWANGEVVASQRPPGLPGGQTAGAAASAAAGTARASAFRLEARLVFERDTWIVAEVGDLEALPDGKPLPPPYGLVVPRGLATGFTNPVFLDRDGNGRFDAPGLANAKLPPPPVLPAKW